jgi:hypothetical protein
MNNYKCPHKIMSWLLWYILVMEYYPATKGTHTTYGRTMKILG